MIQKMVLSYAIGFIMRQIDQAQGQVDWEKLKVEVDAEVRAKIPGEWLDDEAVKMVNVVIDETSKVLANDQAQFKTILELLAAKSWDDAGHLLLTLLIEAVKDVSTHAVLSAI